MFASDVEIYTNKKWRLFSDLDGTETFATLNPNNYTKVYQSPIEIIKEPFKGLLYRLSVIGSTDYFSVHRLSGIWYKFDVGDDYDYCQASLLANKQFYIPYGTLGRDNKLVTVTREDFTYDGYIYGVRTETKCLYVRKDNRELWLYI